VSVVTGERAIHPNARWGERRVAEPRGSVDREDRIERDVQATDDDERPEAATVVDEAFDAPLGALARTAAVSASTGSVPLSSEGAARPNMARRPRLLPP
jgi:hypothetical protein